MRTYVRMTTYVAYHQNNRAGVAFWSAQLAEVAQAVAAQPDPMSYEVCRHQDGFAAPLRADDQAELDAILASRHNQP
jgi:hypothetical protein